MKVYSEAEARAIVMARNNHQCEAHIEGVCQGRATNYQHRKRRSHCTREELWSPANGLAVCGSGTTGCHGWMTHAHPAKSYDLGWNVKAALNPAEQRVWMHNPNYVGPGWYLLADDGSVQRLWEVAA